jgi:hypothetical protein
MVAARVRWLAARSRKALPLGGVALRKSSSLSFFFALVAMDFLG